jgi:hypothetical protein
VRTCKKCGQDKPLTEFKVRSYGDRQWTQTRCKTCVSADVRAFKAKHQKVASPPRFEVYGATRTCTECHLDVSIELFTPFHDRFGRERRKAKCRMCATSQARQRRKRQPPRQRVVDDRSTKVCKACKQELPRSAFEKWIKEGKWTCERGKCRICDNAARLARYHASPKKAYVPKAALCGRCGVARVSQKGRNCIQCSTELRRAQKPQRVSHPCTGCGAALTTEVTECFKCRRGRQNQNHVNSDVKARLRAMRGTIERFKRGKVNALFWLDDTECWSCDFACSGCGKPMIYPSKCWTCATGLPRSLARLPRVQTHESTAA